MTSQISKQHILIMGNTWQIGRIRALTESFSKNQADNQLAYFLS